MLHLNIFWAWTKKNWKLSALAVWSIFIWLVSRKNADGAIQAMKANKESYEAQIQGLKDAHEEEIQKRGALSRYGEMWRYRVSWYYWWWYLTTKLKMAIPRSSKQLSKRPIQENRTQKRGERPPSTKKLILRLLR